MLILIKVIYQLFYLDTKIIGKIWILATLRKIIFTLTKDDSLKKEIVPDHAYKLPWL